MRSNAPVTLADLAPTIADLAGATPERLVDGVSVRPGPPWRSGGLARHPAHPDRDREGCARDSWKIRGVRTGRYTYGRDVTNGFEQLYDRRRDPDEVRNVADRPTYRRVRHELRRRTQQLRSCAGAACRTSFGTRPGPRPRPLRAQANSSAVHTHRTLSRVACCSKRAASARERSP